MEWVRDKSNFVVGGYASNTNSTIIHLLQNITCMLWMVMHLILWPIQCLINSSSSQQRKHQTTYNFSFMTQQSSNQVPISLHRVSIMWEDLTWSFITTMNQWGSSICYDLTTVQWKLEHHPFSHGGIYTYIWPPFRMQHFHIHFLVWKWLHLDSNFTFPLIQHGSRTGDKPLYHPKQQWYNLLAHIYASLGLHELHKWCESIMKTAFRLLTDHNKSKLPSLFQK